jgi:hypothetical protein
MPTYYVKWEIDIDAENHEEAAREALAIQRDPGSIATVFDVRLAARRHARLKRIGVRPAGGGPS